jgi:hypothetical protein
MFMPASASRRDRPTRIGEPCRFGLLLAGAPHARRASVDAICINIYENDQEIAAVMVTAGATQCMTRAKRKKNEAAGIRSLRLCQYDFWQSGLRHRASQFETAAS